MAERRFSNPIGRPAGQAVALVQHVLEAEQSQFETILCANFLKQLRQLDFYGSLGDVQTGGDFFVF